MNMEKKQTSIEWLIERIYTTDWVNYTREEKLEVFEQAKQMEKEQIENAYWDGGQDIPLTEKRCKQYYNETYNNEDKSILGSHPNSHPKKDEVNE